MKRIGIFYTAWTEGLRRLAETAKKMEVEVDFVYYGDLKAVMDKGQTRIEYGGKDLGECGLFYFRAVGDKNEWLPLLLDYAREREIPVVDGYLSGLGGAMRKKKLMEAWGLKKEGVAYPKTAGLSSRRNLIEELKGWKLPVVVKSVSGRHGIGTYLVRKMEELELVLKGKEGGYLIQEYMPNDGDYRIFLVGGKVVGAFKRLEKETERVTLSSSVGKSEVLEKLPPEVENLAREAALALGVEIAGIDLVIDQRDGQARIVEVNQAPEFEVMERRTGKDIAGEILEYLLEKCKE